MRDLMRSWRYGWAILPLVFCPATVGAQEDGTAQALERLGAIVRRDDTKPNRPVVAVIFGLRPLPPDTTSEAAKDALLAGGYPIPSPETVKVTDADLKDLGKLEQLEVLDLCGGEITNKTLEYVKDLKNLQVLDLRKTRVDNEGMRLIKRFKGLKKLCLTDCPVTDAGLKHL